MEWTERGPVRATLEIERKVSRSVICQKIHFYAACPRIDFETTVDRKEHQHLLKAHFPMDVHTDEATFEIQFGNVTCKTHQNTSWDQARFESCGQKWIDVSEGHYGISLLNDCKYGHSVHNGEMALTLIKSGTEPNPVADQEMHVFTYALYPHAETWRSAETVAQAHFLNQPVRATAGGIAGEAYSLASVDAKNVILETVKQAGANPCPPIVLGIGIGGSFDKCAALAKKALLRPLDQPNADPYYAALEKELLDAINATGFGPQGFGGATTCLGVCIEQLPTHVACLPVAVNVSCHVTRRASAEV